MTVKEIIRSRRFHEFLQSFGPAWVVMIADVDAPSVLTAAEVGATYGYGLIWFFLVLILPLFLIQEAAGRIGVATGRGLGEVIRKNYSKRIAIVASLPMAVVDVVSYTAEFAGIAIGMQLLGVSPLISLPIAYAVHVLIIFRRKFATIEKALVAISFVLILTYAGSLIVRGISPSNIFHVSSEPQFLFFLAATAGAVVMPFMLFYQASATAEKDHQVRLWAMRTETLIGAVASEVGMVVIAMASSGLTPTLDFMNARSLSSALSGIAGNYAPYLFGLGLVAAAFLALVVISLASSWAIVEAVGWGKSRFFWVYFAESIPAVIVPMFYPNNFQLVLNLMVVFVFVLVGPGVVMGLLASDKRIMGKYVSNRSWKVAYWISLIVTVSFGILAIATML